MVIPPNQDMPPPGGYQTFNWSRTFPRTWFKPGRIFAIGFFASTYGTIEVSHGRKRAFTDKFEDVDVKLGYKPFLLAERDRSWLKMLRNNRDMENEIMKDVPGWKTGTWYGEPVYFTTTQKWWDPSEIEVFAHSEWLVFNRDKRWRFHEEYAKPHFWDKYMPDFVNKYCW